MKICVYQSTFIFSSLTDFYFNSRDCSPTYHSAQIVMIFHSNFKETQHCFLARTLLPWRNGVNQHPKTA